MQMLSQTTNKNTPWKRLMAAYGLHSLFTVVFFFCSYFTLQTGERKRVGLNMAKRTRREKREEKKRNLQGWPLPFSLKLAECPYSIHCFFYQLESRLRWQVNATKKKTNHLLLFIDKVLKTRRKEREKERKFNTKNYFNKFSVFKIKSMIFVR